jgi:hypothetical protein
VTSSVLIPKGNKEALMNSILDSYHVRKHKKAHKKSSDYFALLFSTNHKHKNISKYIEHDHRGLLKTAITVKSII